jgi:hypothetical protein
MPTPEFLQLLVVALVAGYIGYLLGRASAKSAVEAPRVPSPLPAPENEPVTAPRRAAAPPPAGAGRAQAAPERTPPRRSSAPPPAAAGLMKRDE